MGPEGCKTILLAEDDAQVRELLRLVLEREGYTVLAAADGVEAFDLAQNHHGPLDLLLTDVDMPRMTGPDLAQQLLAVRRSLKVVYLTADPSRFCAASGQLPQGRVILKKPISLPDLLHHLGAVLAEPGST